MKRLENLNKLTTYLTGLRVPDMDIKPIRVVDEVQAASRLAMRHGVQIIVARPDLKQEGDSDSYTTEYSTAIFVVEKIKGASVTEESEDTQFNHLVNIACNILGKIEDDISSCSPELMGLDLVGTELFPVSSIFGGWNGYSMVLAFR